MANSYNCYFDIAPIIIGKITYRDLIEENFGLGLTLINNDKFSEGILLKLETDKYYFEIGILDDRYYMKRNEYIIELEYCESRGTTTDILFYYNKDTMLIRTEELDREKHLAFDERIKEINTLPIIVPYSLKEYLFNMNIEREDVYENENEFFLTVIQLFQHLQDKINRLNLFEPFWNTLTEGSKIVKRIPKSEVELHSIIHSHLDDLAKIKNIDITPEYPIGGGNLDFLFSGSLKEGKRVNICVEFKLAHSQHLENGLENQLPTYMRNKHTDYGIYVVLLFKGSWFLEPTNYESYFEIKTYLDTVKLKTGLKNVRIEVLDLAKKELPSSR